MTPQASMVAPPLHARGNMSLLQFDVVLLIFIKVINVSYSKGRNNSVLIVKITRVHFIRAPKSGYHNNFPLRGSNPHTIGEGPD